MKPPDRPSPQPRKPVLGVLHSPPGFELPRGACDSHVHVFQRHEEHPYAEDRPYMPGPAGVDALLDLQQCLGLERVVLVQSSMQGLDNHWLLRSLAQLQQRGRQARGVAVLPPCPARDELQRLHLAGIRGLRVNLWSFGVREPARAAALLRQAADTAGRVGWHVQLYAGLPLIAALAPCLRELPVPVVVDHFGMADAAAGVDQPGFQTLLGLVAGAGLYVKLSAAHRLFAIPGAGDVAPLLRALVDAAPDRMLWGSDWPHTGPWPGQPRPRDRPEALHPVDDGRQLALLHRCTSDAERDGILVHNPARLYGFGS